MDVENNLATYDFGSGYDEMFVRPGVPREHCRSLLAALESLTASDINDARRRADLAFLNAGITLTVYSESSGIERIFPFDVIPRLIAPAEWDHIERGLKQRIVALNGFVWMSTTNRRSSPPGSCPPRRSRPARTTNR